MRTTISSLVSRKNAKSDDENPLNKRIPRMLTGHAGKLIAILLFLVLQLVLYPVLVAEQSLRINYDSTFEEYNIEDGHFELFKEMSDSLADALGKEELSIFPLWNKDVQINEDTTFVCTLSKK